MQVEKIIGDQVCYLMGNERARDVLIQPTHEYDMEALGQEVKSIGALMENEIFLLVAFRVTDWNRELSPWVAPAVFGKGHFGAGAKDTLAYITETLVPEIERSCPSGEKKRYYLGGYSLAGLFALWAAYQTELFQGVAAVSPSVWFPQWITFAEAHAIRAPRVYLSLGDREERTRNNVLAKVGNNIRRQYELMKQAETVSACTLEWNPGNHFVDGERRMAKSFAWLLQTT